MQNVLFIAFHFPPFSGSSGVQRTLSFVRHLPKNNWNPVVLTADPRAYPQSSSDQIADIPQGTVVVRTRALDAARDLAVFGVHSRLLTTPDRWWTWRFSAVKRGLDLTRAHSARVIWSTYPIATAHRIGARIHGRSRLPWIADFRDPMIERDTRTGEMHPRDGRLRGARARVEELVARHASKVVFCTDGARRIFLERHPRVSPQDAIVIANGFDDGIFSEVQNASRRSAQAGQPFTLLHSGIVYPGTDRDPSPLFAAIRRLLDTGRLAPDMLRVVFRGSGHDEQLAPLIGAHRLDKIVSLAPGIPYRAAIEEMFSASALIVLQGYTSNPAIPAKLYEYLRVRRPLLAIVDPEGETAKLLARTSVGFAASPDSVEQITLRLIELLDSLAAGHLTRVLSQQQALEFSREHQAGQLAEVLDSAVAHGV
jgi:hypothetical protein